MKRISLFSLIACLLIGFSSCKKSVTVVDPSVPASQVIATIYPKVNQPTDVNLGDPGASFITGDRVIVYVPFELSNDEITFATLIIRDEQGQIAEEKNLMISTDYDADGLNVPSELMGQQFMYAPIDMKAEYVSKMFTISIEVRGNNTYSIDQIPSAFTVFP